MKSIYTQKAYTLLELMMALFLSSIIMLGLYGFIVQFRLYYSNIQENTFQNDVYNEFIDVIKADISFTNSIQIKHQKKQIILEYLIPKFKEKNEIISGKKCKIIYNKKLNQVIKEDMYFQWSSQNFIEKNFVNVEYLNTLLKTFELQKNIKLNFSLRYSSKKKIRPIILNIIKKTKIKFSKERLEEKKEIEILLLGNS